MPPGKVVALLAVRQRQDHALRASPPGEALSRRHKVGDKTFFDAARRIDLPARRAGSAWSSSPTLWPHRTVFENVAYGLELRNASATAVKLRVGKALGQIGLTQLAARYPHQLSGGQQQRVALARALVYEPAIILLDEPLSNLDAKLREEARAWLRQLIMSLGLSALLVTHDQIEAMAIADRITLLDAGAVDQEGTPTELYQQPATLFAAEFMGNNNRLEGTLVEKADKRAVIEVMGAKLEGVARTGAAVGERIGVIRLRRCCWAAARAESRLHGAEGADVYRRALELVFVMTT